MQSASWKQEAPPSSARASARAVGWGSSLRPHPLYSAVSIGRYHIPNICFAKLGKSQDRTVARASERRGARGARARDAANASGEAESREPRGWGGARCGRGAGLGRKGAAARTNPSDARTAGASNASDEDRSELWESSRLGLWGGHRSQVLRLVESSGWGFGVVTAPATIYQRPLATPRSQLSASTPTPYNTSFRSRYPIHISDGVPRGHGSTTTSAGKRRICESLADAGRRSFSRRRGPRRSRRPRAAV